LKIPKGVFWEAVNRRTDNATAKSKKTNNTNLTKNGKELWCFVRVSRTCFTSYTRRVTIGTNPVISHEGGKNDGIVTTRKRTYQWPSMTLIFINGDVKRSQWWNVIALNILNSVCSRNSNLNDPISVLNFGDCDYSV